MPFANLCNSRNTNHRGSLAVNARSTDFESTNAANYGGLFRPRALQRPCRIELNASVGCGVGLLCWRSLNGTTLSTPIGAMFANYCLPVRKKTSAFPFKRTISLGHDLRYPPFYRAPPDHSINFG